jgi:hypothetical protein
MVARIIQVVVRCPILGDVYWELRYRIRESGRVAAGLARIDPAPRPCVARLYLLVGRVLRRNDNWLAQQLDAIRYEQRRRDYLRHIANVRLPLRP